MNSEALNALDQVVAFARRRAAGLVPVAGVAGPQGSGKTTLVTAYAAMHTGVAHFSIDDFYIGKKRREGWARDGHPLLATRGPPPTHDLPALLGTLDRLQAAEAGQRISWPAFDKLSDDILPEQSWPTFTGKPDVILVDGWCVGAKPQGEAAMIVPVNALERDEDGEGHWRRLVNRHLAGEYQAMFDRLHATLYLRAPRFKVVLDWRCEQEEGLLGHKLSAADRARISRFIQHFERITRHMMAGGRRADIEVQLDERRNVTEIRRIRSSSAT